MSKKEKNLERIVWTLQIIMTKMLQPFSCAMALLTLFCSFELEEMQFPLFLSNKHALECLMQFGREAFPTLCIAYRLLLTIGFSIATDAMA